MGAYDARMNRALETERLSLRPFTPDDAGGWHAIWGDPEVIWWGANDSIEKSRASLERLIAKEATWPDGIAKPPLVIWPASVRSIRCSTTRPGPWER